MRSGGRSRSPSLLLPGERYYPDLFFVSVLACGSLRFFNMVRTGTGRMKRLEDFSSIWRALDLWNPTRGCVPFLSDAHPAEAMPKPEDSIGGVSRGWSFVRVERTIKTTIL